VTTDPGGSNPEIDSKPAIEVTTGFGLPAMPAEPDGKRSVSACEAYGEMIAVELSLGRNAMGMALRAATRASSVSYASCAERYRLKRG